MEVRWYLTAGDYVGLSCSGNCPVYKDPSQPAFASKIKMSDRLSKQGFYEGMVLLFNDPLLKSRLALQAEVGKLHI